jgi:hypothetical protein
MAVYLLHSTIPLVQPSGREVQHYLGCTTDGRFPERLREHYANRGSARVVQAILLGGGELCLGNYWPDRGPAEERQMKRNGHLEAHCLLCRRNELLRQIREMNTRAGVGTQPSNGASKKRAG